MTTRPQEEHTIARVRRRRASLLALMLIVGLGLASWVTRTPAVRDAVDASTAQMGLILFGLSIGSMVGVLASGPLVARIGTRPIALTGIALVTVGVAAIALSTAVAAGVGVFVGLLLFGLGGGLGEIALNIEGAEVERLLGKPVLPLLHGFFSLGTVIGALAGIWLTATEFPALWHLLIAVVAMLILFLWAVPGIPAGLGITNRNATAQATAGRKTSVWREPVVVLIGVVVLAMAFAEGAANDWLPLLIVDGHDADPVWGSLVYAGFAAMMTIGRFAGGPVVVRFGRQVVLRVSAIMAILGVIAVAFAPNIAVAMIAVVLWGLGASLGFPVAISAAGDNPDRSAERVSAVATSGYLAFLVGPPLLGFVGELWGLPNAMLIVAALLLVATIATFRLPGQQPQPAEVDPVRE